MKIALIVLGVFCCRPQRFRRSRHVQRPVCPRGGSSPEWSQVDVALQRRADLIPNLVETVKGFAAQEKEIMEAVANARAGLLNARGPAKRRSRPTGGWTPPSGDFCWWWRTTRT